MTDPRQLADTFISELSAAAGNRISAAALFGSAARGEWIEGVSDVNVLILLDNIDAPLLSHVAPPVRAAVPHGVRPLIMEIAEWRRAGDVFGIELADMRDAHVSLLGDDPTNGYMISIPMLRLQAERELRAKLLNLHAGMLLADDRDRLGQLFVHALPSFVTYLRTVLRLATQPVPTTTSEVITSGCALIGADSEPFLEVLEARVSRARFTLALTDPLADQFNNCAERLAAYVDAYGR